MDLKELRSFQTILKEGSFSKAAQNLNYAQSTVTTQIQKLEKEIGFSLFDRGAELKLTAQGELFAKEVDSLIDHWHYVIEHSSKVEKEEVGILNIGINETVAIHILSKAIKKFREIKPHIICNFVVNNSCELCENLNRQTIDFAIGSYPADITTSYYFEELYKEKMCFIISRKYAEIMNCITSLEELSNYPLLIGGERCLYNLKFRKSYSHVNTTPFCYTVSQITAIPYLIHEFPSVGVVISNPAFSDDVIELPIEMEDPFIPIGIILSDNSKYLTNAKSTFLDIVRGLV